MESNYRLKINECVGERSSQSIPLARAKNIHIQGILSPFDGRIGARMDQDRRTPSAISAYNARDADDWFLLHRGRVVFFFSSFFFFFREDMYY